MAHDHATGGSDKGAAFTGLIGGAILIGVILYGIVLLTNQHFAGEKAEHGGKTASRSAVIRSVQG